LKKMGIVNIVKDGKDGNVTLTEKGKKLYEKQ